MRRSAALEARARWYRVRARPALATIVLMFAIAWLLAPRGVASSGVGGQDYDYDYSYGPLPELVPAPEPPSQPFEVFAPPMGSEVFAVNCSACHGTAGEGTAHAPQLIGEASGVFSYSREGLYDFVSTRMPFSNPGSLSEAEYWAVVDFLRVANGI